MKRIFPTERAWQVRLNLPTDSKECMTAVPWKLPVRWHRVHRPLRVRAANHGQAGNGLLWPFRGNGSRTLKRPFCFQSLSLTRKSDAAGMSRTRSHAWNSRRLSASFSRPRAPRASLYPDLAIARRAALHMIDKRAQLRHDLSAARIAEKQPRPHRRVRLQHLYQFPRSHPNSGQRLR